MSDNIHIKRRMLWRRKCLKARLRLRLLRGSVCGGRRFCSLANFIQLVFPASKRYAAWNEAVFVSLAFEFLAEIGMRETNDGLSAFGDRLPFQIDHAEFGDHIHNV